MIASRVFVAAAAFAVVSFLFVSPALADVLAGDHELVVLAEPAAPAAPAGSAPLDLTLTWTVREIFAGEPSSVTIAVRHEQLQPSQVASLSQGGRWLVLADPDAKRPGRWVAGMPLRATPAAIEAFRSWSAPPDVRPERDLEIVVAEVAAAAPPVLGPAPIAEPEPARAAAPESFVAEGPVVDELVEELPLLDESEEEPAADEPPEAPIDRDSAPQLAEAKAIPAEEERSEPEEIAVAESPDWTKPSRVEGTPAVVASPDATQAPAFATREPAGPVRIAEVEGPEHHAAAPHPTTVPRAGLQREAPPLTWRPALQPPVGPGLPPPPPRSPLGRPLAERDDLKKARSPSDEGA